MKRTGIADLPLHGGRAPAWLFQRMSRLASSVAEAIALESGPREFLRRLADPFWFQAFGCLLGFDWHSSGLTTTVCGAVKTGLSGRAADLGILVAGGKGKASLRTPREIETWQRFPGLSAEPLVYASRLAAKVDNTAVQDGFTLYHHTFFALRDGSWTVVQQGMHASNGMARRYHWLGEEVRDFVDEPHAAVCGPAAGPVLNFVAAESAPAREVTAALSRERPERLLAELDWAGALSLPRRHGVHRQDVSRTHLHKILLRTYEAQPEGFERLLGMRGVGPRTLRALNLLSELLYGSPASTRDPAAFSFAHGGKDGVPYPVDRETYDRTIDMLSAAVSRARLGRSERLDALRRLSAASSGVAMASPPSSMRDAPTTDR